MSFGRVSISEASGGAMLRDAWVATSRQRVQDRQTHDASDPL